MSTSIALRFAMLAACGVAASFAHASERPNVILIVVDDFGWADLGCYGSRWHQTPNIDQLASQGMRFTDAYSACPVCSPTRAAIMTGKYPARLHLTDWLPGRGDLPAQMLARPAIRQQLPLEETTLADALHAAGYTCACIGKWHLGGEGFEPTQQGFQLNVAGDHTGTPLSYFAPFGKNGRMMPGLEQAPGGEYLTDRLTQEAERFIEANASKPFFLYMPHYTVHIPLTAKQQLIEKYQALPRPPGLQNNPVYAAMIESLDDSIGRLMTKLDELKLADSTIVCFTSDNGGLATAEGKNTPATNNSPLREGKGYLYEGGIRVPLIVRWPAGVKSGTTSAAPVSSIDLLPTLLELCNVKQEGDVDGVTLSPVLKQTGVLTRDALYWHYPHYSNQGGKPGGAVRAGDWKLIEFYEDGRRELFNVKQDVRENRNLAEERPDLVAELSGKLASWRKTVAAQEMTPNPKYLPNPQADDGSILLHARSARIEGIALRFEPMPHKNTLGYWTRKEDVASWEFMVTKPGSFQVEVLQGCGKGSGGSEISLEHGDQQLTFNVQETGGFQNFVGRDVGVLLIEKAGRQKLTVRPRTKPGAAVMDLRQIVLKQVN